MREESERPEPVVDGHDDHAALHQLAGVVFVALANGQGAAVDPHHHRTPVPVAVMMPIVMIRMASVVAVRIVIAAPVGRVHVEEQAILGHRRVAEGRCSLRTMIAELCRVLRDGRGRHGLRRLPAQIQGHRLGVPDAEEFPHGACGVELALELAVRRCHQRGARERPVSRRGQCEGCAEQHGAERAPQPQSRPR